MNTTLPVLTAADFASDQDIRWCPGCGDYSILAQMKKVLPDLGVLPENTVFISGIGCSSRFPYYMNTYGIHSIHGPRSGVCHRIEINPAQDLSVWVITGDGDALSIGGNHLLHVIRRNLDINIILFNNRIYGLTKGQYSPTSQVGHVSKSTPVGSIDYPLNPISVALAAEATFTAHSIDVSAKHLIETLTRAAHHRGTSFVEVYQNCNVFNDGAWDYMKDKETKDNNTLILEHGKPMIFGGGKKGIRLNGWSPEVVDLDGSIALDDLLFHDESADNPLLAFLLSRLRHPDFPEALGVFRCVERETYDAALNSQVAAAIAKEGAGQLDELFQSGETWTVN